MKKTGKLVLNFIKKEAVLCAALLLGIISMFLVHPDREYPGYINFRVLGLLFSLMVVMAGLSELGIFDKIASVMLRKADNSRKLYLILVFLCFFSAMLITNDVALITFVPFTLLLLKMAKMESLAVPLVVYETVAANLGSALTPIGNPHNLYLYTAFEMSLWDFLRTMAPITGISAVLLLFCMFTVKKEALLTAAAEDGNESVNKEKDKLAVSKKKRRLLLAFYGVTFLLSLLTVLRVLPAWIPFGVALLGTMLIRYHVLLRVDYSLLLTFVGFFVFVGNMGRIDAVSSTLARLLGGREILVAFLTSQVISNVPASALLSGFTENAEALLVGVNIGGMGTLIASMASLISYKYVAKEIPEKKGRYFGYFTLVNLLFATLLLLAAYLCM
ncbi:MAG: citrate transporter [Lachnospiraceae bacterium]|nr:citrate transporter [Lachnospiraceae bacterium]